MNYKESLEYLFTSTPLFQHVGGKAYKEGLETTNILDEHFGHPHTKFRTVHVGGTNGKGSCAHTIAAMLQHAGYKVGLYTSPHLVDFRERIRINGEMISEEYVTNFVNQEKDFFEPLSPSFFEIVTAMAFKFFADVNVDVAVIEVGLGGRLDCTNIISPVLSVITNISLDHTQFLGNTLAQIASEKAGIIKGNTPVVIGEYVPETRPVFADKALKENAPIYFAQEHQEIVAANAEVQGVLHYITKSFGEFNGELAGDCQIKNTNTILCAAKILAPIFNLKTDDIHYAFEHVCEATGLQGRWQKCHEHPIAICDTGHNVGGWQYLSKRLAQATNQYPKVHIVFGMSADKDIETVLTLLPHQAQYYWTHASVRRAMNETDLSEIAHKYGLSGKAYPSVAEAYKSALGNASPEDFVYVGGSCFIVADLLSYLKQE